jgi:hypothetical protein
MIPPTVDCSFRSAGRESRIVVWRTVRVVGMNESGTARRRVALCLMGLATGYARAQAGGGGEQRFPDVVAVKVRASGPNLFDFDVTISSPYDTPRRYADGFRVHTRGNEVLGDRKLFHDHQDEQPFTRDLHGVAIPPGVKTVLVQARDQKFGYGGKVVEVTLPGR